MHWIFFPVLGISLALTIGLELAWALLFRVRGRRDLMLVCLVNVLTNPPVVLLRFLLGSWALLPLEAGAVLAEGLCYRAYGERIPHPWLFALSANLFSYGMGVVLNWLI